MEAKELLAEIEEDKLIFSEQAIREIAKLLSLVVNTLVSRTDIRERTQIDENEQAIISLLKAINEIHLKRELKLFPSLVDQFIDEYLHLAISKKRKGRTEIIEAIRSAISKLQDKTREEKLRKLLTE